MNVGYGICYVLTPDQNFQMKQNEYFVIYSKAENEDKVAPFEVYLIHPEDRYGYLLPYLGLLGNKMEAESGNYIHFKVSKITFNYISSKRNCRNYETGDSYSNCIVRNQVDCYKKSGPERGCNCTIQNLYLTHFELQPIPFWDVCKTDSEFKICQKILKDCYWLKTIRDACPLSCQKTVYKAEKMIAEGTPTMSNTKIFGIGYATMDVEEHNEVWILDTPLFIGTVGGSLGLFIGFSYTGFFGQILDYFVFLRNY